ncbi:SLAM family member 9-like [Oxyura jamaicensis]|uniref:SLAM family member 9-like n=1 Tax=Oxyura jamaicensis TaxID=8884 RepID=UPI0015A5CFD8|nr:SLAM family member 9-like [Oxyura jamaicensis]
MEGDLARSGARLPALLLALLGLAPELLFGRARAQPQQVIGILGGSVLLSPALPPSSRVKEIEWSFSAGAGATIQVAEFGPGGFERPDPQDRFKQRLEMLNATALRIGGLELGDSGVYGARIKLHPALVEDQSFNLSVYESVPSPRTRSQLLASTVEWCNLTLQCQGAGKGAVNVTWRRDNGRREPGTDRSQLSPDGTTLRLALQPGTANATYACTVSNPADQKVVLFDLQSICRSGGGQATFSKSGYVVLTLILLAVSLGGAFWCWRLNSEKAADPAATPTVPAEEGPPDPQYAEIVRRSPPEGNDQVRSPREGRALPASEGRGGAFWGGVPITSGSPSERVPGHIGVPISWGPSHAGRRGGSAARGHRGLCILPIPGASGEGRFLSLSPQAPAALEHRDVTQGL